MAHSHLVSLFSCIALLIPVFSAEQSNPNYLALGDSIAFGYSPLVPPVPVNFTGYPEVISGSKHVQHVNKLVSLACPGETSASFLSVLGREVPGRGCRDFKANFGLHTDYSETQMSRAVSILRSGKQVGLVTLTLGGNDLLLLQSDCAGDPECILSNAPAVIGSYGTNLRSILQTLRSDGKYSGRIVLVTCYSPDYTDLLQTGAVFNLNSMAAQIASEFVNVSIASGFEAFAAASGTAMKPCSAGLLITLPDGTCDVHPSSSGQSVLAATVLDLIGKNKK